MDVSQVHELQTSLTFCRLSSHFLSRSPMVHKVWISIKFSTYILSFVACVFGVILLIAYLGPQRFKTMFSLRVLKFWFFPLSYWVNFFIWCEVGVPIHSVGCVCPTVQLTFVGRFFFSTLVWSWHPCQKSINCMFANIFPDSQFYSIDLFIYSYASTMSSRLLYTRL